MFRKITIIFMLAVAFRIVTIYAMEQKQQSSLCKIPCEMLFHISNYLGQKDIFNLASTCYHLYGNLSEKRILKISGSSIDIFKNLRLIKEKKIECQDITLLLIKKTRNDLHCIFNEIDDKIRLKITKLYLVGSNLLTLPEKISHLSNLTYLDLKENKLNSNAIKMLGRLTNLTRLSLRDNTLQIIPQEMSHLSDLSYLDLNYNCLGIYNAPVELGNLSTKLSQLYLSENSLRVLPEKTSLLTNLTSLDLSSNHIESKSLKWLSPLTKLTKLSLRDNVLDSLPEEIGNLSGLTLLNLSSNKLKTLPEEIEKLTRLTTLYLGKNELSKETAKNIKTVLPDTQIII